MIPLADARGADRSDDAALADLVEELTERLQAGDPAAPDDVLRRHPAHADRLRPLLPALQALAGAAGPPARPAPAPDPSSGVLGDFRIIREVGRGGMGVVYEARQISLNRRVALKVLPFAAGLNARQLQRFKTEAQAAANLHHQNIVPVYAVGCDRGVHYYAMQFIEGTTLAQTVAELRRQAGLAPEDADGTGTAGPPPQPYAGTAADTTAVQPGWSPPGEAPPLPAAGSTAADSLNARTTAGPHAGAAYIRTVAAWGAEAAEALDYAHQLGVVHRDVKPANLMVDGQGRLWVTDFGLARFAHEGGVTMTGELLGTLRYMSPEQATARRGVVDHRTDVFALGVTLYELLTLEPAHPGRKQHELLAQVVGDEVQPPRRLNRAIPVELETVVLKAVATAQELADDLRRFLADQPIRARRPTPAERVARWGRRHRRAVCAGAFGAVLAAVVFGVTTVQFLRQRDEAEWRGEQARRAVDRMYTQVGEKLLRQQPYLEPVQREFLKYARDFYLEFARTNGRDPGVRLETGTAFLRVADIEHALGKHDAAAEAYDTAVERLKRLAGD
jgi:eukaryotic-like serine/threonine-protein kinase